MGEQNLVADVRDAKAWVDRQSKSLDDLGRSLRAIESAYRNRSGAFATVPSQRSESVSRAIEAAENEPGQSLLSDVRPN
jgi:hypothetical protein